ncbi:MAG: metallophosphoesterase family protein [Bacteroidetes bacterium]|nr:metallophosphoesterase family protein [Bacteroidota bacterium]
MRIGFLSDIHEDVESLRAAIAELERRGCDQLVCLGDIVGFTLPFMRYIRTRDANRCLEMVRDQCVAVVAGNHDLYAVRRTPEYNAGFPYRENWYELDYDVRARLSKNRIWLYEDSELPPFLTPASSEYLRSLPEYIVMTIDDIPFFFSHFHYPDLSGSRIDSLKKARELWPHFRFMTEQDCLIGCSGHGHPEGYARSDLRLLRFHPFGSYQVERTQQWIVCPCVANTTRANGVMVFDTRAFVIEAIPLASGKTIV